MKLSLPGKCQITMQDLEDVCEDEWSAVSGSKILLLPECTTEIYLSSSLL